MDIQKIITEIVEKLQGDNNLLAKVKEAPVKTIESLIGIDLPDEQIDAIVKGVMAKLDLKDVATKAQGFLAKLKSLFAKK